MRAAARGWLCSSGKMAVAVCCQCKQETGSSSSIYCWWAAAAAATPADRYDNYLAPSDSISLAGSGPAPSVRWEVHILHNFGMVCIFCKFCIYSCIFSMIDPPCKFVIVFCIFII
jgi:hypothetical protein